MMRKEFREVFNKCLRNLVVGGKPSFYLVNGVPRSGKTKAIEEFMFATRLLFDKNRILIRNKIYPEALTGHQYDVIIFDINENTMSMLDQLRNIDYLFTNVISRLSPSGIFIIIGSVSNQHSLSIAIQQEMFLKKDFPKFEVVNVMESYYPVDPHDLTAYQVQFLLFNGVQYMEKWIEFQKSLPYYFEEKEDG